MVKQKNKISSLIKIAVFLFSLALISLESNSQAFAMRMTTDFSSFALSAMAPIFKMGYPYINYWGINPPGLLMFIAFWGVLAGSTLQSFHILYLISLSTIIFLTWIILNRFFSLIESLVLFFIFSIIFFSGTVQSQFFPSEINGLLFTLIGLYFTLKNKISKKDLFWASFFFILAGQMKEVFAFTGLALFPHLLKAIHIGKEEIKKIITYSLLGILASFSIIIAYLGANNSIEEYKNILSYKSTQFPLNNSARFEGKLFRSINYPKERFIYLNYQVPALLFFSFVSTLVYFSLIAKSKKSTLTFSLPKTSLGYSILLFFWIGSTIGYIMQGRYGNKYEIQSLLPMILIVSLSIKIIFKTFLEFFKIKLTRNTYLLITAILLTLFLMPKKFFFIEQYKDLSSYNFRTHIRRWFNLERPEVIKLETHIKTNTKKSDCITAIYGWGVGSHYYYSQRESCSKHFLVNIIPKGEYENYGKELLSRPPKAIIYDHGGADLDIAQFESNAFDFSKVVESCYKQDEEFPTLYWSNFDQEKQSECLLVGIPGKFSAQTP